MTGKDKQKLPHIYLEAHGKQEPYKYPRDGRGSPTVTPKADRQAHTSFLKHSLEQAICKALSERQAYSPEYIVGTPGIYLQIQMTPEGINALKSLEAKGKEPIELVHVSEKKDASNQVKEIDAVVFVPDSRKELYAKKISEYGSKDTPDRINKKTGEIIPGKPKNERLIARIDNIAFAMLQTIFTGAENSFPDAGQTVWWEVWLRSGKKLHFEEATTKLGIRVSEQSFHFIEREVVLACATPEQLDGLIRISDCLAEVRLADDTPAFFMKSRSDEQVEWGNELRDRVLPPSNDAPAVCLLDSGTTRRHLLISPVLRPEDQQAWDSEWSVEDISVQWQGHGTQMSGLALYGDLVYPLASTQPIQLTHCLESVKILPDTGANEPHLYGVITSDSVAKAEIAAPFQRRRVVCLPVTSSETYFSGKPSQWSAAIDNLLYDGETKRLMVISAGNIREDIRQSDYLNVNDISPIENPAQSWNALTVGAYTDKVNITAADYAEYTPIAEAGGLSPRSRTGISLSEKWINKPDIVFEGGNLACEPKGEQGWDIDDLQLLTTHNLPEDRLLTTTNATSAATALAARMAAQILTNHPHLWSQTVRALIVHSAKWTEAMWNHLPSNYKKTDIRKFLLRRYGYGVPSLERALNSLSNDVTLVVQDTLQPFERKGSSAKTRDMKFHKFAFPNSLLESLGEEQVEMQVTLSYYIEPNPGERGWTQSHTYASHGLRFKVKGGHETDDNFRKRINKAAQDEEDGKPESADETGWVIGTNGITKGSIHSDVWKGQAAELASKDAIAVFPVGGWWKEKPNLERSERMVHYALIVSIKVPTRPEIDLYTQIALHNAVESSVSSEISIDVNFQ